MLLDQLERSRGAGRLPDDANAGALEHALDSL
jgi:hypothetical protein